MKIENCIHLPEKGKYANEEASNKYIRENNTREEFIQKTTANYEITINNIQKNLANLSVHSNVISFAAVALTTFCYTNPSLQKVSKTSILLSLGLTLAAVSSRKFAKTIPRDVDLNNLRNMEKKNICNTCADLQEFIVRKDYYEDEKTYAHLLASIPLLASTIFFQASQYFSSTKCKVVAGVVGGVFAAIGTTIYGLSYTVMSEERTNGFDTKLKNSADQIFPQKDTG
ncbi:MAG: hypothetical protein ChlgKO_03580 [Chlamydiales bacterium]